ncbi:MAG: hypothetical protein JXB39_10795 [Deltaproteobacteria bacterium]|nr:hypothetical protein [Deltaproteobacteria bacterium]
MRRSTLLPATLLALGCHDEECDPDDPNSCGDGQVCEVSADGTPACFAPLLVEGRVFNLSDGEGIERARVVALDANSAPRSRVATSDTDGLYSLQVPAERDEDGAPVGTTLTLRADAAGYLTFPSGARLPFPVDTSGAVEGDDAWVLASTTTDIGLIVAPVGTGTGSIQGVADVPAAPVGILVVAEGEGRAVTAIADLDGAFTIFNLSAGDYSVRGYGQGVSYDAVPAEVSADETTEVALHLGDTATGSVSGTLQIVNAPGGSRTSVILVVEATFDEDLARGETPPGLRAAGVSSAFDIEGVPAGRYVVLAAFENDLLVRDPDTSIGGTQIQHVEVAAGGTATAEGFKITEALAVLGPGASEPEAVSASVTLSWVDDSSEDLYEVRVVDAYGNEVWSTDEASHSGDDPAVPYEGPLEPGMYYQFRATSLKDGVPISTTEDLLGVFWVPAE